MPAFGADSIGCAGLRLLDFVGGAIPVCFGPNLPLWRNKSGGIRLLRTSEVLFKAYGYTIPASSSNYAHWGRSIERDSIKPGDFLLFAGRSAGSIGHVGLCVGRAEGKILMLHSATHSGVLLENWVGQSYYESRYAGARRGIAFRFGDEASEASGPIAAQDPEKAL